MIFKFSEIPNKLNIYMISSIGRDQFSVENKYKLTIRDPCSNELLTISTVTFAPFLWPSFLVNLLSTPQRPFPSQMKAICSGILSFPLHNNARLILSLLEHRYGLLKEITQPCSNSNTNTQKLRNMLPTSLISPPT